MNASTSIEPVTVAALVLSPEIQPRDRLYDPIVVDAMRDEGQRRENGGSGWCPTLYEPIHVWEAPEGVVVLEGFHRAALATRCGVETIAAVVHRGISRTTARDLADRSNLKARPMDPLEEADAYRRALDAGRTVDEIARSFGCRGPGAVERRLMLAWLAPRLRDDVRRKLLPVDYAEAIGQAAKDGASASLQAHLAGIARTTKVRVDLFRRLVAVVVAKSKATPGAGEQGGLFDLGEFTDTGIATVQDCLVKAAEQAALAEGHEAIERAVKAQVRRLEKLGIAVPSMLVDLQGRADAARAEADREVARTLGEPDRVREARPYLKWAGGKRKEAPILAPLIVGDGIVGRYVEPFCGSAAVFFHVAPERAVLNDALAEVMACHRAVRDDPQGVARALFHFVTYGTEREAYLKIRAFEAMNTQEAAARTIYLNRLGFNGLYRTNKAGGFNVPFGDVKDPHWPTVADLSRAAEVLKGAVLCCGDWRSVVREACVGDVVFCDPPYPGTFDGYATAHDKVDPAVLADHLHGAVERGARVVVTYPATTAPHFETWCDRVALDRRTNIAATGGKRARLDQVAWISR